MLMHIKTCLPIPLNAIDLTLTGMFIIISFYLGSSDDIYH